ncbi:MAG: hypothetical protein HOV80_32190, partial [Polyangiaceae bacterium]|nr:hypothetical protein [Polyangiaceae bacterium]
MTIETVRDSLAALTEIVGENAELEQALANLWRRGARRNGEGAAAELSAKARELAETLATSIPALLESPEDVAQFGEIFDTTSGSLLFLWCAASTWRRDVRLAPLFEVAAHSSYAGHLTPLARARVVEGPLLDAFACVPLLGKGQDLVDPENGEAVARLEILLWEAGASALEIPVLGPWIWGDATTFEVMIEQPAHGTLLGRVIAARCLEVS